MVFEKVEYGGWPNCYRLASDTVELIITSDVGPRIIRFGFIGQDNEFCEVKETLGKTGGDEWRIYGGHRFWHAPEVKPRTYYPDNNPVSVIQGEDGAVHVRQPVEPTTGIEKEMDITLDSNHVRVVHRLRNHNLWTVELAPWALSVMNTGGKAIIPLPPRGTHEENLLPANIMTFWAYTDMSDSRWTWGRKYVMLAQDPNATTPQKVGVMVPDGWAAYARNGHLFVKVFGYDPDATYPDWGCSMETFSCDFMLEVESVAPLVNLQPGAAAEHVEDWYLYDGVPMPETDVDVDTNILPKVQK